MRARVSASTAEGVVHAPGSKSYTIRAALCAAMAEGESLIAGALQSDDSAAVFDCVRGLGADVSDSEEGVVIRGGCLRPDVAPLWCRESGATFRFLAALAATIPGRTILRCAPSLARRPMQPLVDAIRQLGAECHFDSPTGTLTVGGRRQQRGHVRLRGDVSSQFLSAMLLSGPRYDEGLHIDVSSEIVSERYVQMTLSCMREFGVEVRVSEGGRRFAVPAGGYVPIRYMVEGDWSAGAALLGLGALAGDVRVLGLCRTSLQADVVMVALLQRINAQVHLDGTGVRTQKSALEGVTFDLAESIDLLPVACVLAATADGVTRLTGIARARDKESDRVAAMAEGLTRLGVRVDVEADEMRVWGGAVHGGVISSAGDHRIAMAFGALGAAIGDIVVDDAGCVSKTFPGFWESLSSLGVKVQFDE